jgi:hypothetical protein
VDVVKLPENREDNWNNNQHCERLFEYIAKRNVIHLNVET